MKIVTSVTIDERLLALTRIISKDSRRSVSSILEDALFAYYDSEFGRWYLDRATSGLISKEHLPQRLSDSIDRILEYIEGGDSPNNEAQIIEIENPTVGRGKAKIGGYMDKEDSQPTKAKPSSSKEPRTKTKH